jgi:hypothetical protein
MASSKNEAFLELARQEQRDWRQLMKKFIATVLSVSIFFLGLGTLVDKVGAKFKSDEKALDLIAKARQAIGGDAAIASIQSMRITGKTTRNFNLDGSTVTEQGDTDIALQLPNKFMKMVKIGHDEPGAPGATKVRQNMKVVVVNEGDVTTGLVGSGEGKGSGTGVGVKKVIVHNGDGSTEEIPGEGAKVLVRHADGDNAEWKTESSAQGGNVFYVRKDEKGHHEGARQNELLRTTLGLLLTAPQGMDISYNYAGEGNVNGTPCNIVEASSAGSSVKLFLGKDSNLPMMMSFVGTELPRIMHFKTDLPPPQADDKDTVIFTKKLDAEAGETAEVQVTFSDYRSVNGVQLPYHWTQTLNGATDETFDVTNYEINPANIGDFFKNEKVFLRTPRPDGQ